MKLHRHFRFFSSFRKRIVLAQSMACELQPDFSHHPADGAGLPRTLAVLDACSKRLAIQAGQPSACSNGEVRPHVER